MGSPCKIVRISQQDFDALVMENVQDLGMDPAEALADAIETLKLQGVDLSDVRCAKTFQQSDGPKVIVGILSECDCNINTLNSGFAVVAAAASGNEVLKEAFMELNIDELLVQQIATHNGSTIQSLFDAVRVLLTPDDTRVLASQWLYVDNLLYQYPSIGQEHSPNFGLKKYFNILRLFMVVGYARRFAKIGMAKVLVDSLCHRLDQSSLVSASLALRSFAVNEEICRMIAENGGIDVVLQCISDTGMQNNKAAAIALCSLLSKLAASDANKSAIVEKQGLDKLIQLSSVFAADPTALQEIMSTICVVSLRSPENAASAMEAGAGDLVVEAMMRFPRASQMQRQACLMIRNLVVRNPENRDIFLNNGTEKIIRQAKHNHESCKRAATDALRDLGLDSYND